MGFGAGMVGLEPDAVPFDAFGARVGGGNIRYAPPDEADFDAHDEVRARVRATVRPSEC